MDSPGILPANTLLAEEKARASKSARFKSMLAARELAVLMEAHDGLSAKVVEAEGFEGIWASGFSISTAMGLRDSNEASSTQILGALEFMSDATSIPIVLDGDTGYGNFNNARRLVKRLCQMGVASVCLEDKLFPKLNSFVDGCHPLADLDEFCGKLKACKDSQTDDDFCLIARVEALIAGQGLSEALRRAEAYRRAGADAIFIHSKKPVADEVLAFAVEWDNHIPLVISPTTYYSTPLNVFRQASISVMIWANHNIRAAMTMMQRICRELQQRNNISQVEDEIVSLQEVFEFMGYPELVSADQRYNRRRPERSG